MKDDVKKAVAPFKILIVLGMLGISSLTYSYLFYIESSHDKLISIADGTDGNIELLCNYENCVYIVAHGTIYVPTENNTSLTVVNEPPDVPVVWLTEILHAEKELEDHSIVIYSIDWHNAIDMLVLLGLVFMLVVILVLGWFMERRFMSINEDQVTIAEEKGSLENNLRMLLAATAHHEMLTPIAVIKSSVMKLMSSTKDVTNDATFTILNATVDRLESVLNQMSAVRNLYKKPEISIIIILRTTLESLQVIFTEFNFKYEILKEEDMLGVRNYKLESGTISNILNNLFKNSLEAGATKITVAPTVTGNTLTLMILDNGGGIPPSGDDTIPDVFELGYSNKGTHPDIINANQQLSSKVCRGNGLFLVRTILKSAGGKISLVSTCNMGTVFKLTLPIKRITGDDNES